jgi:hypothetical protein
MKPWGSGGIAPPFLTSALDGADCVASRPCRFIPRGNRNLYPLYRRLGGPKSRSGRYGEEKNLASAGNRTPAVQHVASRYTNWAIPTPKLNMDFANLQVFHILTIHGSRYIDSVPNQLNRGLIVCVASKTAWKYTEVSVSGGSFMV